MKETGAPATVPGAVWVLLTEPGRVVLRGWNWKASLFSSLCRGAIFFVANIRAGLDEATGAMFAEFLYRAVTAGIWGAVTQHFRAAEPRWLAMTTVLAGVPLLSHILEFCVHWLRGTPSLRTSIIASVIFTVISTLFNLHAMRGGILVVGQGERSLADDMRAMPRVVWSFLRSGFGWLELTESKPDCKNPRCAAGEFR